MSHDTISTARQVAPWLEWSSIGRAARAEIGHGCAIEILAPMSEREWWSVVAITPRALGVVTGRDCAHAWARTLARAQRVGSMAVHKAAARAVGLEGLTRNEMEETAEVFRAAMGGQGRLL